MPELVRSDVWILTAILMFDGNPIDMRHLRESADYLMRRALTFDEVSFGVPRLVAAGLAEVATDEAPRLAIRSMPKASSMVVRGPGVIDIMFGLMDDLGCRPYPEPEDEDRSLRRLPGLDLASWQEP